jgi:hypothetical protein
VRVEVDGGLFMRWKGASRRGGGGGGGKEAGRVGRDEDG